MKKIIAIALILIIGAFFFRYDEEYIEGRALRYDRFLSSVEVQRANGEWGKLPQFKNLQHVHSYYLARRERDRQEVLKNYQAMQETARRQKVMQQYETSMQQFEASERARALQYKLDDLSTKIDRNARDQEMNDQNW